MWWWTMWCTQVVCASQHQRHMHRIPNLKRMRASLGIMLSLLLACPELAAAAVGQCDEIATEIVKIYNSETCIEFVAGASDFNKVTLESATWCRSAAPCRKKLSILVAQFYEKKCSTATEQSSAATSAAAVAISNTAMCSQNGDKYCAEQMDRLYYYANQKLSTESRGETYVVNCDQMRINGDLEKLGCCVSTFARAMKEVQSSAAGIWATVSSKCAAVLPDIALSPQCVLYSVATRCKSTPLMLAVLLLFVTLGFT